LKNFSALALLAAAVATSGQAATTAFGTYEKMFSADSLWNSQPVKPVLGTFVIPKDAYFPSISTGAYSSGIYKAAPSDPSKVIYPRAKNKGVWDPDGGVWLPTVTIPHWPADLAAATGADGHADVVDVAANKVYSFWQLAKGADGRWTAQQFAWTTLNGNGWGEPAHYFQGARAAAVPTSAGMIRKHEVDDGKPRYEHALAMSLTYTGLSKSPTYIFPATSADSDAAWSNKGQIPEGARVMLPSTFDTSKVTTPKLRKVAETLKTYGAYVVDRNVGTPFVIYVENGANWKLMPNGWSNTVAAEEDMIRAALRQVVSQSGFINGNGKARAEPAAQNLLSMRGPWVAASGSKAPLAGFDTLTQSLTFGATTVWSGQVNTNGTGLGRVQWAKPVAGKTYKFAVTSTGAARMRISVYKGGSIAFDSGGLGNGASKTFVWPAGGWITLAASKDAGPAASVSASLTEVQ
jgi:hypothetical protein